MCLILFAYRSHPEYPLIVAANRDEFYARPTAPAGYWEAAPTILAGRDLKQGGTWLGVTVTGRFAALTNYRDPANNRPKALSRGHLVAEYLKGNLLPTEYIDKICSNAGQYNGFNLLLGDMTGLWYYSNQAAAEPIKPGIHGLSNHLLDTPWPKVERGKRLLQQALTEPLDEEKLGEVLVDSWHPQDSLLPQTGVGLAMERILSPMFIASEGYGTRAMSIVTFRRDGLVRFTERSRTDSGEWRVNSYQFTV